MSLAECVPIGILLTPVVMGDNGAQRSWRPVDHIVKSALLGQKTRYTVQTHSLELYYVDVFHQYSSLLFPCPLRKNSLYP